MLARRHEGHRPGREAWGYAAKTAARLEVVDELVIADLSAEAASAAARECGTKSRGTAIDVRDPAQMQRLFGGAGAVLNTVGPFFRLGPPVLRAAINARVHYLDINDDWESTEAMLAMDTDARAAGITAVIGMGASPGITNLLACQAVRELDDVDELIAGFDLDAAMPEQRGRQPAAATIHGLHQLTGAIRVFEDGRFADARPMRRIDFDYPGLGPRAGWTMGHPEAISFPRRFPQLRCARVLMWMAPSNRLALRAVCALIDARLASIERAAAWVEYLEGVGAPVKTPEDYVRRDPPHPARAACRRSSRSRAAGAAVSRPLWRRRCALLPPSALGGATGVPLATALGVVGLLGTNAACSPGIHRSPSASRRARAAVHPVCRNRDDLVLIRDRGSQ